MTCGANTEGGAGDEEGDAEEERRKSMLSKSNQFATGVAHFVQVVRTVVGLGIAVPHSMQKDGSLGLSEAGFGPDILS